jgi:hypothetical protein
MSILLFGNQNLIILINSMFLHDPTFMLVKQNDLD